jgi:hypothetical protein
MGTIEINTHGPLFDGRAAREVHAFLEEAKHDIGQQGYSDVMHMLEGSIRHPTPYYETQVLAENVGADVVVHDRGIIYGPWLEGVGSRNAPVTIFPGYHSFRRATAQLRGQATGLAERLLEKYVRRMQ